MVCCLFCFLFGVDLADCVGFVDWCGCLRWLCLDCFCICNNVVAGLLFVVVYLCLLV